MDIKALIFYLLLADALIVSMISWGASDWYKRQFPQLSRALPLTRTWTTAYLVIVAWIGYLTF